MKLQSITSPNLINVESEFSSKNELIRYLTKQLNEAGKLHSEEEFYQAVLEREKLSPTGFEGGLAIPHGKSNTVKKATFAVATLKTPLTDWESIDPNNKVQLVFLLAIPESEAGNTHLELLAELVKRLSDSSYKNRLLQSTDNMDFFNNLDRVEDQKESLTQVQKQEKTILAITACPAGIAHTYVAAEAIIKAGEELGVKVFVEKQGANGIEDRHTTTRLRQADAVIFANDVAIKDEERFSHLPKIKTSVADPLRNATKIVQEAIDKSEAQGKTEYKSSEDIETSTVEGDDKSFKTEIKDSVLTGISYMIPIIIAGGMTLAAAVFIAQAFGLQEVYDTEGSWLWLLRQLGGGLLGTLMVPVLAAYMAYSIADKPALGPGFAAGLAANLIGSGFLGGMLGGILAGYVLKYLKKKVKPTGTFAGFVSFWVYPVLGTLIVGITMLFIVGEPLAWLNQSLTNWLESLQGTNALILGAIIGAFVSFDLGDQLIKQLTHFVLQRWLVGILFLMPILLRAIIWLGAAILGAIISMLLLISTRKSKLKKQNRLAS